MGVFMYCGCKAIGYDKFIVIFGVIFEIYE